MPFEDRFTSRTAPFAEAYRAASESAAVFDRNHRCRIRVTGRDREPFLQNMLSNDVRGLSPGMGVEATFLTNKGKLVSDLVVYKEPNRLHLELERDRVQPLIDALGRYVISEDVSLESLADEEARFSVEGPRAPAVLESVTDTEASELAGLADLHFVVSTAAGVPVAVVARASEPSLRLDVVAPRQDAPALVDRVLEAGAVAAGEDVAETRRVEAGRPRFGVDMDVSHLPLEAGLERAISFDKGCYIGQEYVVRLAHRGQVNRKLMGLRIDAPTPPERGSHVLGPSGSNIGQVTSARFSPQAGTSLALAYLRREAFEEGTPVTVVSEKGQLSAKVAALPFRAPSAG